LLINTVGALGNAGLASTVILNSLPRAELPGAFGAIVFDLAGALMIRVGVMSAIQEHRQAMDEQPETIPDF
jgi:hypothetical protein